jgi:hypothetical protein
MPKVSSKKINDAVRLLEGICENELVLTDGDNGNVYLTAMVHNKETAKTSRENGRRNVKEGTVEYMVCDGPPGDRSLSNDFYDLYEALEHYKKILEVGWEAASRSL